MPKLSYTALLKIAHKNGAEFTPIKDEKGEDKSAKTEAEDFGKVTDWLIANYPKQTDEVKQKIADDLLHDFNIDINQLDETLFKEELETALFIHLLETESDENIIIDWIIKYDSPQHNGFGDLTQEALTNPHDFSFDGIIRLVKNIAESEQRLASIQKLKALPFNPLAGFEDDIEFKQNKQDFFAELARLYAQAAITREAEIKAQQPEPELDSTIPLDLKAKEYLHALELGQLTVDKLLRENKNGIEILFNIHQYLYKTHGDSFAANQRNPVFGQIENKLIDFYKIGLPDLMRGKQPGFLKSYYEAIVEKRAQSPKAVKSPPAKDLTLGVLAKPKEHQHVEDKPPTNDQKQTVIRKP